MSLATIRKWAEDSDFPRKGKQGYNMSLAVAYHKRKLEKRNAVGRPANAKPVGSTGKTLDEVRIQKELLNCGKLEREIAKMDGQLVSIDDLRRDIGQIAAIMPQAMEQGISKAIAEQQPAHVIDYLEGMRDWVLKVARTMLEDLGVES